MVHATNSPPAMYSNSHNANTLQGYDASNGIKTVLAFNAHYESPGRESET